MLLFVVNISCIHFSYVAFFIVPLLLSIFKARFAVKLLGTRIRVEENKRGTDKAITLFRLK